MNLIQLGWLFRAERIEQRLLQSDVAARAGICASTLSLLERGRLPRVPADTLSAVARVLGLDLDYSIRGGQAHIARLRDERHARLVELLMPVVTAAGWLGYPEATVNYYGDRASIDILCWHPLFRAILIVEVKTTLVDVQDLLSRLDVKLRVVPLTVAKERNWEPRCIGAVLVLPESDMARGAVARHGATFDAALPARTRQVRRWIRHPEGSLRGIWFFGNFAGAEPSARLGPVQRVRRRRRDRKGP